MTFRFYVLAVAVAAVVGCNAPEVRRESEVARLRAAMTQAASAPELKPGAVLDMPTCEKIAFRNSLSLRVQQLALRLQDEQVRLALSGGLPKFHMVYRDTERSNAALMNQGGMIVPADDRRGKVFNAEATMPVLDYGATYYAYQIAKDQKRQQELLYKRAEQQLRRDVRVAYVRWAGAQREEVLAGVNIQAADEMLKLAVTQEREGLATPAETAVFRAALEQAKADRVGVAQRAAENRLLLLQLMGLPPGTPVAIDPRLPTLPAAPTEEQAAALEAHALAVRPELAVQDLERHVSANAVRKEFGAFFPRVDAIGAFSWSSSSLMVNPAYFLYGAQVASELLDSGAQIWRYRIAEKSVVVEQERALLLALGVLFDVDLRAMQLTYLRQNVTAQEAAEKARKEALDRVLTLYREGLENAAGTARALADLNYQSLNLYRAQTDYLATWHELEAAALPYESVATTRPATPPATRPATRGSR